MNFLGTIFEGVPVTSDKKKIYFLNQLKKPYSVSKVILSDTVPLRDQIILSLHICVHFVVSYPLRTKNLADSGVLFLFLRVLFIKIPTPPWLVLLPSNLIGGTLVGGGEGRILRQDHRVRKPSSGTNFILLRFFFEEIRIVI